MENSFTFTGLKVNTSLLSITDDLYLVDFIYSCRLNYFLEVIVVIDSRIESNAFVVTEATVTITKRYNSIVGFKLHHSCRNFCTALTEFIQRLGLLLQCFKKSLRWFNFFPAGSQVRDYFHVLTCRQSSWELGANFTQKNCRICVTVFSREVNFNSGDIF